MLAARHNYSAEPQSESYHNFVEIGRIFPPYSALRTCVFEMLNSRQPRAKINEIAQLKSSVDTLEDDSAANDGTGSNNDNVNPNLLIR